MANFPITEDYNEPLGQFIGYDTANAAVGSTAVVSGVNPSLLQNQSHIDIRGLVPSGIVSIPNYTMLILDEDNMNTLDALTMAQLDSSSGIGDNWTSGNVQGLSYLNNVQGLVLTLTSGINTTTSTLDPVDLSQGFQPNDYVCLSLPHFPAGFIDQTQSYVSLSDGVNTQQLFLNASSTVVTSGNVCASWPYSSLSVLKPSIVSLVFKSNFSTRVDVSGLRLLSQAWTPLTLDMNTEGQFLRPITTQSGIAPTVPMPMAWRCAVPQGVDDPRPIDSTFGAVFYTGSLQHNSTIDMYFRGRSEAGITQLDLDYVPGAGVGYLQSNLDGLGFQPDFGVSYFQPSTQTVLNQETQNQLNLQQQWQLERVSDITNQYWIHAGLTYQANSGFTVGLNNYSSTATDTYSYTASGILPQQYYLFNTSIANTTIQMSVYPVSINDIVATTPLFKSPAIMNGDFRRTAGRIGWGVTFGDGDAFIKSMVSQSLIFAEYKSKVFQSRTPVKGASLTVSATPPTQLFIDVAPFNGSQVSINTAISDSATGSFQIYGTASQGLQTNIFNVTDFSTFTLNFSLYIPSATLNVTQPLFALLNSDNIVVPFSLGIVLPNLWQDYTIPGSVFSGLLPGSYQFITFSTYSQPTKWYIDNISISEDVIVWAARSQYQDPWNANPITWTNFTDQLLNNTANGVTFEQIGPALQIRAQAHQQNAVISNFWATPYYSQLGNLQFSD